MSWWNTTERERWKVSIGAAQLQEGLGLTALDYRGSDLYGRVLPRGASVPRFESDRPPLNSWLSPYELSQHVFMPGQIMLGKFNSRFLGLLDDRPMVTIAGARAGKTSTVLEPNLYLYPGSMLILDPKAELARTARLRGLLGHAVFILDPFSQSGGISACFNALAELDPKAKTIVDDVAAITQALVIDDGDARSKRWTDNARTLLQGIILLVLLLPEPERHLVTVRDLLSLSHPRLLRAARKRKAPPKDGEPRNERFFDANANLVETLLGAMADAGSQYGGVLAGIGNRFLAMPKSERGSVFSTASVQTDFLNSLSLREISTRSDLRLASLRGDRPVTICLCLPVGRMESHHRWLRLVVQLACTVLERLGPYPRERPPILFMMEEFATLGRMELMERAAAYFPGFGIKLWAILQDITQLKRYYDRGWETFLGNAGLVQCFANGDQSTLDYLSRRMEKLIMPFELRTTFSRRRFTQLLLMEGLAPAAAQRLDHEDVIAIRAALMTRARTVTDRS